MQANQIITETATEANIEPSELGAFLAKAGWDFSPLTGDHAEVAFVRKTVSHYAGMILTIREKAKAREAAMLAADAEIAELRAKRLTAGARANPSRQCGKCDGSGRIRAFSHIERGVCFQCGGAGVLRLRAEG